MKKILKTSAAFSLLFKSLLFLYPLCIFAFWFKIISSDTVVYLNHQPNSIGISWGSALLSELTNVPMYMRFYDAFIDIIPTAIVMLSFYYLHKLFSLYARGIIFSKQNSNYLQKIGITLLMQPIAAIFAPPFMSYILKLIDTTGVHPISIVFTKTDCINLIIGGIVILISWVMHEALQLKDELALTI